MNEEIIKRVVKCVKKVIDTPAADDPTKYDEPLTGTVFQLSAIDMTYLLLEVTDEFKIRFEASDVENYGFNSINKIAKTVEGKLQ
ncbi:MAG: hypothetical protein IJT27_10085 [Clostridia bacterium]|nr:hypothetical protein [Clostridia bacterium]